MVAAARDVLEALFSMGITIEAHEGRLRYRPRSAMTPDILEAVKSCKAELLEILESDSLLPGSGGSESRQYAVTPDAASGARAAPADEYTTSMSRADREFLRFESVAVAYADGSGLFDPTQAPAPVSGYIVPHPAGENT